MNSAIERARFDAVLFTLDGVLVQTDTVFSGAWQEAFDEFLARRVPGAGHTPFDPQHDYDTQVHGRAPLDAAQRLLDARNLVVPTGKPNDTPRSVSAWGLANAAQARIVARLRGAPPPIYEPAVRLARTLRGCGIRVATVSLSRQAEEVLRATGMAALFHARVDGRDLERFRMRAWPAPDLWLEALRRLEVPAARAAAFVAGEAQAEAARAAGITTLWDVTAAPAGHPAMFDLFTVVLPASAADEAQALPSALAEVERIAPPGRKLALFLDFDGTLTGITGTPREAILAPAMRDVLASLAERTPLAIVSGRDLDNLQARVGLSNLWYAGSHGFDIAGPDDLRYQPAEALACLPALDAAEQFLRDQLAGVEGALVERKRFALAAHYRPVAPGEAQRVKAAAEAARSMTEGLRASHGKKVIELLPDVDWHKGRAMQWLLERMAPEAWPVYIGDDQTDEDAFILLAGHGAGIVVQDQPAATAARYRLRSPDEVLEFLSLL
ncbi:MAG: trehalose-phosphatase [Thiohalomonadaceae bacterium]